VRPDPQEARPADRVTRCRIVHLWGKLRAPGYVDAGGFAIREPGGVTGGNPGGDSGWI
ncbi:MAG: hypothetical protein AVDCRST_MAG43-9, partial [uncultured Thermomicrobiales bacterium]